MRKGRRRSATFCGNNASECCRLAVHARRDQSQPRRGEGLVIARGQMIGHSMYAVVGLDVSAELAERYIEGIATKQEVRHANMKPMAPLLVGQRARLKLIEQCEIIH